MNSLCMYQDRSYNIRGREFLIKIIEMKENTSDCNEEKNKV